MEETGAEAMGEGEDTGEDGRKGQKQEGKGMECKKRGYRIRG